MGPMPYEITWRLMLLKVLHRPPRPIRIFIPKSKGEMGILMGPIPYGITWRLMLLKVLHKPPRPIRIFMRKSIEGKTIKRG